MEINLLRSRIIIKENMKNLNYNSVLKFLNISIGNSLVFLNNKKSFKSHNKIYESKKKVKNLANIVKLAYIIDYNKGIKINGNAYIENNKKKAKTIIKNKQYKLIENIHFKKGTRKKNY